jgi:hypothetical protein
MAEKADQEGDQPKDPTPSWIRSSPADLYFLRNTKLGCLDGTQKMKVTSKEISIF